MKLRFSMVFVFMFFLTGTAFGQDPVSASISPSSGPHGTTITNNSDDDIGCQAWGNSGKSLIKGTQTGAPSIPDRIAPDSSLTLRLIDVARVEPVTHDLRIIIMCDWHNGETLDQTIEEFVNTFSGQNFDTPFNSDDVSFTRLNISNFQEVFPYLTSEDFEYALPLAAVEIFTVKNPDIDEDGVADASDDCPITPGVISNRGCPITPTPPSPTPLPRTCDLPERLSTGNAGQVTPGDQNTLRAEPSRSSRQLRLIPPGGIFNVIAGPVCDDGFKYWQVNYQGTTGWTAEYGLDEEYWLVPYTPPAPTPACNSGRLSIGDIGEPILGKPNDLYRNFDISSEVIGAIPLDGIFEVFDTPRCEDGYQFLPVRFGETYGWIAEYGPAGDYWLAPYIPPLPPSPTPACNSGRLSIGGAGQLIPGKPDRVYEDHDIVSPVIGRIPVDTIFTVTSTARECRDGYWFLEVTFDNTTGWVAEYGPDAVYWLEPAAPGPCESGSDKFDSTSANCNNNQVSDPGDPNPVSPCESGSDKFDGTSANCNESEVSDLDEGIPDDDNCPDEFGSVQNNGCPLDRDNDGVADDDDNCPDEFGSVQNDGCPLDRDNDDVPGDYDSCPDEFGSVQNDGCPHNAITPGLIGGICVLIAVCWFVFKPAGSGGSGKEGIIEKCKRGEKPRNPCDYCRTFKVEFEGAGELKFLRFVTVNLALVDPADQSQRMHLTLDGDICNALNDALGAYRFRENNDRNRYMARHLKKASEVLLKNLNRDLKDKPDYLISELSVTLEGSEIGTEVTPYRCINGEPKEVYPIEMTRPISREFTVLKNIPQQSAQFYQDRLNRFIHENDMWFL